MRIRARVKLGLTRIEDLARGLCGRGLGAGGNSQVDLFGSKRHGWLGVESMGNER